MNNIAPPAATAPPTVCIRPEQAGRDLACLVLALCELLRRLLEAQALRRLQAGTLSAAELEAVGQSLCASQAQLRTVAAHFDLTEDDLRLDLGPLGKLF